MSTIQQRLPHLNLWWYAAAAVLAGAVLALIITALQNTTKVATTHNNVVPPPPATIDRYQPNLRACFAPRPGGSIELLRSACTTAR